MFGISKEELLEGLLNLNHDVCSYSHDRNSELWMFDCKYGYEKVKTDLDAVGKQFNKAMGEKTGCPELHMAYVVLKQLTDEQFYDLCAKARIIIT